MIDRPTQRGAQIVVLGGEPGDPDLVVGPEQVGRAPFGEGQEVGRVVAGESLRLAQRRQLLGGKLAHRLQHREARRCVVIRRVAARQTLPHHSADSLREFIPSEPVRRADRLDRVECRPAAENLQASEERLLVCIEQIPALLLAETFGLAACRLWRGTGPHHAASGRSFWKGVVSTIVNPRAWTLWIATDVPALLRAQQQGGLGGASLFLRARFGAALVIEAALALAASRSGGLLGARGQAGLSSAAALAFLALAGGVAITNVLPLLISL